MGSNVILALTSVRVQEAILRDETILRGARSVDFPAKPAISNEVRCSIQERWCGC